MNLPDCPQCRELLDVNLHLLGAAASVGIEHGKSTGQVITEYLAYHHRADGHQEEAS